MFLKDKSIPFSPNELNALCMLIDADYYNDAINLNIKDVVLDNTGIKIHQDHKIQYLFSKEQVLYIIKLIFTNNKKYDHTNLDFDDLGNLILYQKNCQIQEILNLNQVKFVKLIKQFFIDYID